MNSWAAPIPAGILAWDVTQPGSTGQFDIVNMTGPNSSIFPDTTFPISTTLNLSSLMLTVDFTSGPSQVFGSSYFTLNSDGISLDGGVIPIGGTNPLPTGATLTGNFSPLTVTLNDGTTTNISAGFTAAIPVGAALSDGDFAIIYANPAGGPVVPEPGTWMLMGIGVGSLTLLRRKHHWRDLGRRLAGIRGSGAKAAVLTLCVVCAQASFGAVNLNLWTSPDNGVAGISQVWVNGTNFPAGTITPGNVLVTLSTACGAPASATAPGLVVKTILGSTKRVEFLIPGTLSTGTYFVALSDSAAGDANFDTRGTSCSKVKVTHTNPTLSACIPTSSLGVLAPTNPGKVTAYVPNGCWSCGATGIQVVDIEGGSAKTSVSTPQVVNSCSSNPATGQTVCTANNTDVYLLKGTTLNNTLTSGSNTTTGFSGGSCHNCGVAINALSNKAVIAMGFTPSPSNSAIQFLDLNTNTFGAPVPASTEVSEDISVDPTRNLILSASENGVYDLFQIQSDGVTVKEFGGIPNTGMTLDSSGEDCSTGIAVAPGEFSNNIYLADLTQATFTPGSPAGTWTAPHTTFTISSSSYSFSAGLSGITIAPGSSHLGVATGEFGGNTFAVIQLPATSGSGTPTILDYAVAAIPDSATCGGRFSAGLDPHTVTAYTSPNDGKAYALFANSPAPTCLARIDLAAVLAAPRNPGTHDVSSANFPAGAAAYYSTH